MLIAPEKGEDLRKNLKDLAGDWTKKLGNLIAEGKEQFNGLASSLEKEVRNEVNELKDSTSRNG